MKEESKYLGPTGIAIKWYLTGKSVGLLLRKDKAYLWDEFTQGCKKNNININPEGGEHMIENYLKMRDALFPLAKSMGLEPKSYMSEQIDAIVDVINNANTKKAIVDFRKIREKAMVDTKHTVIGKIRSVLSH